MKFLLLEDDNNWASDVEKMITAFSSSALVRRIASERKFRCELDTLIREGYDVAILDVMVGWATVDEIMDEDALAQVPAEVEAELEGKAKWRAGLRCSRLLSHKAQELGLPCPAIIFYTVVAENDLGREPGDPATVYLEKSKGDKPGQNPITDAIQSVLQVRSGKNHHS